MTKKYKNFSEQVNGELKNLELLSNEDTPENLWEDFLCTFNEVVTPEEVCDSFELDSEKTDIYSDDFAELTAEYIDSLFDGIYQFYTCELKGAFNLHHERMFVTYSDELESYVLPVFAYGMPWKYLAAM